MKARFVAAMALMLAPALVAPLAHAQDFPNRAITVIVPYTPGDGPDVIARLVGDKISQSLGQAVVIENKAGASGQLGLSQAAREKPDGHTLAIGLVTNLALAPHAYKNVPYDPLKDFTPVALAAKNYLALVSRPDAPFKTVSEMVEWAKAHPGDLTIGTTSIGGLPHMSFELLAYMSGFTFLNVPYKGNSAVITDLTGGRTDLGVTSYTAVAPMLQAGSLRLLGITSPNRDPALPDLPTIGESVEGYGSMGWFAFVAPAGTPAPIVSKLNHAINEALKQPDLQEKMKTLGLTPVIESPEYFSDFLKSENAKFEQLVKDINYEPR